MNDNTPIDLATVRQQRNKPVTRVITHEPPATEEPETPKDTNLGILRAARRLVEEDKLDGVIVIGRHTGTPIFHTNHALNQDTVKAEELWAFIGVLHGLASELQDIAMTMGRELLDDGTISDPLLIEPERA